VLRADVRLPPLPNGFLFLLPPFCAPSFPPGLLGFKVSLLGPPRPFRIIYFSTRLISLCFFASWLFQSSGQYPPPIKKAPLTCDFRTPSFLGAVLDFTPLHSTHIRHPLSFRLHQLRTSREAPSSFLIFAARIFHHSSPKFASCNFPLPFWFFLTIWISLYSLDYTRHALSGPPTRGAVFLQLAPIYPLTYSWNGSLLSLLRNFTLFFPRGT